MISLRELEDISVTNIDRSDFPDFADAMVETAFWKGGAELTEDELENIDTSEIGEYIHNNQLYFQ